jgi:alpha-1,3-rhamnosyl/mannosyltransferase
MPYLPHVPTVLTCYDLIPVIFPHYFTLWQRAAYRFANKLALRTASRVIAISETTKNDLIRLFHAPPERIHAIPLGVDGRFTRAPALAVEAMRRKYGLPDRYLLYVGTNKPHKNLERLVEAWSAVRRISAPQCDALVIAGYWDDRYPGARKLVEEKGISESVRFIGPVDDNDLPPLYTGATVFVFPSLYEGFGFPVLEAMACGTPVACSAAGALREVAGDAAALFDPLDSGAITSTLSGLLAEADRLKALAEAALRRAARFTWERTALETLEIYRKAGK